ncbi:hypothetical protein [Salinimicrobium sp. HB62]|uniref:hypothetical protein n=1 Tax=Salinimicrobium sp. HB62 TaxID=3077781 RepID=UPI002D7901A8|nr:hypothetical protein [Salinimicrobium sp. HB62]
MKNKQKLSRAYRKFEHAKGNQYIASEFAVRKLAELITCFKSKRVLEVGLGIGSISGSLLDLKKDHIKCYSGTEDNSYCLKALNKNLGVNQSKLNIYSEIKEVPTDKKFDLVIIDGKDHNLREIEKLVSPRGIIAIEGDRLPQQSILEEMFPNNIVVHSISLIKNSVKSPFPSDKWQGGLKIIFISPCLKQRLWWLKEKIMTKIKYQYPGRHFGGKSSQKKKL